MTSKDNIIYYTLTAVVFVGIVVCSLLFHNGGQPTNSDSDRGFMTEIIITIVIAASAFITAATTIVLAFITRRYVRLTKEYVHLTGEMLKATNKPEVILYLSDQGRPLDPGESVIHAMENTIVTLCLHNIGTGYASDISFSGDLSFQPPLSNKTLGEMEPFKSGLSHLGVEYKVDTPIFLTGEMTEIPKRSFNIIVSYKDSTETPCEKNFHFEVGNWENSRQFISPKKA